MSVYRKDDAGNIKKIGGFLEKRFNPTWFECARTIENGVEVYTVPEAAKDYYTLGFSKVYYFGIFEPNTTDNPKLNFFGQILAIRDLTQPDNNPAPGTLAGVYQMFTEAATQGETAPTEMALMTTVFAGNMIANVSAKALAAGAQPTVENKGTEYRAELEFGIPKGDTGAPGKDGKDGTSLDIQQQIYESPADLPPFAETTVNQAFVVKNTSDGYDMYFHAVDGTDWTIIPNWGGIQGPKGDVGPEGSEGKPALQCVSVYTNGTPAVNATLTISSTFFNRVAEVGDNTLVVWQANSKSWIVLAEVTAVASNVTLKVVNFVETTGLTGPAGPKGADGATGATGATGASYLIRKTSVITTNPGGGVSNDLASNFNRAPVVGDICFFTVATDSTTNPTNCWNCIGQITSVSPVNYITLMYQSTKGAQGPQGPQGNPAAVDSALSTTSENTVQNKVVTNALDEKFAKAGGDVTGATRFDKVVRVDGPLFAYRYAKAPDHPAIIGDKPGGGYWAIGANGTTAYVKFGASAPNTDLSDWTWTNLSEAEKYHFIFDGMIGVDPSQRGYITGQDFLVHDNEFNFAPELIDPHGRLFFNYRRGSGHTIDSYRFTRGTNSETDYADIYVKDIYRNGVKLNDPLEGLGIFRSSASTSTDTTSISISSITVPSGRTLKVGDLIIANSTYSYLYRVTAVGSSTVTVTYLQTLRGATGATGPAGSAGSNAPNFNLLSGGTWSVAAAASGATTTITRNKANGCSITMTGTASSFAARTPTLNYSKTFTVSGTKTLRIAANVWGTESFTGISVQILNSSNAVVATVTGANSDYSGTTQPYEAWVNDTVTLSAGTYHIRVKPTWFGGYNGSKCYGGLTVCIIQA